MIAVAARYGYGGASVARVIRHAGVSRATFYKHFEDRDDCLLAAHRQLGKTVKTVFAQNADRQPGEMLGRLLAHADLDPSGARVCLIEGLAGNASLRAQHEELLAWLEDSVDGYLRAPPGGSGQLGIPARAVVGGIAGAIATRVFRGEAGHLLDLRDDLIAWIESYALPAGRRRHSSEEWMALGRGLTAEAEESLGQPVLERRLPRGKGAISPAQVAREQRERIIAAVAELAREKGYAAMTVADVVATAAVTREVFYEQFRSKEDAFLATQAFGLETSISTVAAKFFSEARWPDRVWNGLEATLSYIAAQRSLVYVDLIESYAAGPAAIRRSFENRMAYTLFLEEGYRQRPEAADLPRLVSEAISGGMQELLRRQVARDRTEQMLELLPQAAFLSLAPFIGTASALDLIESKVQGRRSGSGGSEGRA
jgi:AcrR family transcriptional regulator